METRSSIFRTFGAPSARSMLTSLALHAFAALLILVGAQTLLRSSPTKKERELDIVFYHPPAIAIPASSVSLGAADMAAARAPAVAPAPKPKPNAPAGPDKPGNPEIPPPDPGFKVEPQPEPKPGRAGILAFKDKLASLAQDKIAPNLGAEARHGAADDVGQPSARSMSTT